MRYMGQPRTRWVNSSQHAKASSPIRSIHKMWCGEGLKTEKQIREGFMKGRY
jgi:hypothetical protein